MEYAHPASCYIGSCTIDSGVLLYCVVYHYNLAPNQGTRGPKYDVKKQTASILSLACSNKIFDVVLVVCGVHTLNCKYSEPITY